MNELQYLLVVLSEEATEIMQDIMENKSCINEMNDLIAVAEMYTYNRYRYCNLGPEKIKVLSVKNLNKELLRLQYYISKSLRFGIEDFHPDTKEINAVEIEKCIINLRNSLSYNYDKNKVEAKKMKVRKFVEFSVGIDNLKDYDLSELKQKAGDLNYYIKSWFYRKKEFITEVYRADLYEEDVEDTWGMFVGKTELESVQKAYQWVKEQEFELSKTGQDYITLHKDDDDNG